MFRKRIVQADGETKQDLILNMKTCWCHRTFFPFSSPNSKYTKVWILCIKMSPINLSPSHCRIKLSLDSFCIRIVSKRNLLNYLSASQVVQWQRIHLPNRKCRFNPWVRKRKKWQLTPGFLLVRSHRQRSMAGTVHGVSKESDTA